MRNPTWTRDELILALELYLREPSARGNASHPEVHHLSGILNSLPIHEGWGSDSGFRNPNGVAMKLSNFLRFDDSYSGEGLKAGNRLEEEVWAEFAENRLRLAAVATAIQENAGESGAWGTSEDADDAEASEGRVLTRVHRARERSGKLVGKKKEAVLKQDGSLQCEVCGFDFKEVYGELGEGFAECHHTRPLSEMKPGEKTRLSDLAIVCANCHRMIHRRRPWLSVEELTLIVS